MKGVRFIHVVVLVYLNLHLALLAPRFQVRLRSITAVTTDNKIGGTANYEIVTPKQSWPCFTARFLETTQCSRVAMGIIFLY